jgi:hypothetical protein
MDEQARRRMDRILDPAFIDALGEAEADELRGKLRECREEEEAQSYVRGLLHGRLNLLKAELEVRRGGRGTARGLDVLQEALAGQAPIGSRGAYVPTAIRATISEGRRRAEQILSDDKLARLHELDAAEIEAVIGGASDEERAVSDVRKKVHAVINALETELEVRYRGGLEPPV